MEYKCSQFCVADCSTMDMSIPSLHLLAGMEPIGSAGENIWVCAVPSTVPHGSTKKILSNLLGLGFTWNPLCLHSELCYAGQTFRNSISCLFCCNKMIYIFILQDSTCFF